MKCSIADRYMHIYHGGPGESLGPYPAYPAFCHSHLHIYTSGEIECQTYLTVFVLSSSHLLLSSLVDRISLYHLLSGQSSQPVILTNQALPRPINPMKLQYLSWRRNQQSQQCNSGFDSPVYHLEIDPQPTPTTGQSFKINLTLWFRLRTPTHAQLNSCGSPTWPHQALQIDYLGSS